MVWDFEFGHGVEARVDLLAVDLGAQNPGAQQARAHDGGGLVYGAEQGRVARERAELVGIERREQFEIAYGDRIEHQRVLLLVVARRVQVQRQPQRLIAFAVLAEVSRR